MNVERCPSCAAALRPGAKWCGLCFAPLGAEAEPQRTPSLLVTSPAAAAPAAPVPHAPVPTAAIPAPYVPTELEPAPPPPTRAVHGWPCRACSALNDFKVSTCSGCGAAFLATARPGITLPIVGDLSRLSPLQRMLLALAASPLLAVLLVVLATVVGSVV